MNDKKNHPLDFKKTNDELIEDLGKTKERLMTPSEYENMQGNITKEILSDLVFSPLEDKERPKPKPVLNIKKYLIPISKKIQHRGYYPNLTPAWDSFSYNMEYNNYDDAMNDLTHILTNYKNLLSFHDIIDIYLNIAKICVDKQQHEIVISILANVHDHFDVLKKEQKEEFYFLMGNAYAGLGLGSDNEIQLNNSLSYFQKLLGPTLNELKYQNILYIRAFVFRKLKQYPESLADINEIIQTNFFAKNQNLLKPILDLKEDIEEKMKK